jgi:hypothetical protein
MSHINQDVTLFIIIQSNRHLQKFLFVISETVSQFYNKYLTIATIY